MPTFAFIIIYYYYYAQNRYIYRYIDNYLFILILFMLI